MIKSIKTRGLALLLVTVMLLSLGRENIFSRAVSVSETESATGSGLSVYSSGAAIGGKMESVGEDESENVSGGAIKEDTATSSAIWLDDDDEDKDTLSEEEVSGEAVSGGAVSGGAVSAGAIEISGLPLEGDIGFSDEDYIEDDKVCRAAKMKNIIIETPTQVRDDALSRCSGPTKKVISAVKSKLLKTYNYEQKKLNESHPQKITGTCSEVSATEIAEYYTRMKYAVTLTHKQRNTIFYKMMGFASLCGAYNGKESIVNKLPKLYTRYYYAYKKYLRGCLSVRNFRGLIERFHKRGRPVAANLHAPSGEAHTVTVCGYYDVIVKYKKYNAKSYQTKEMRYYAINDGWKTATEGDKRVQYVREEYMDSVVYLYF